jgi:phage recombination protein Bet
MTVNNQLANRAATKNQVTEYESNGEKLKLSPAIIRQYLVSGDANTVTDQEVMMFLSLCRFNHLNPFLKEAYLIKYGTQPATMVTGKETFMKRANRNPDYAGKEAGIIVYDPNTGTVENREGTFKLAHEQIVGGWAKVYIKGHEKPEYASVSFDEYAGRKKDGSLNNQWATKPATMIRKVALVQALREAFPEDYSGLYSPEEIPVATEIVLGDTTPEVQIPEPQSATTPMPEPASNEQTSVEQAFFGN